MHRNKIFGLDVVAGSLLLAGSAHAQATVNVLTVAEHIDLVDIPNSTYDTGFTQATNALKQSGPTNDVACDLTLSRNNDVYLYYGTDWNIDSQTEYQTFQTTNDNCPAYMFVFNQINWCGVTGSFGGCGWPIGGKVPFCVTRSRAVSSANGIVYAHEYGHTVGNSHDSTDGFQIMDPNFLTSSQVRVRNSSVCSTFRTNAFTACVEGTCSSGSPAGSPASDARAGAPGSTDGRAADYSTLSIEELSNQPIIDRIPVEVSDYYGQNAVDTLRALLPNAKDAEHRRTILTLIGLISNGSDEDVATVAEQTAADPESASAGSFALGYIVNRTGSSKALDVLIKNERASDRSLAQASVLGLGLTGRPDALARIQERASTVQAVEIQADVVDQARADNLAVASLGLRGYYNRTVAPTKEFVGKRDAGRVR